jgi:cellulose synthase/poly-beta-1,6-N-acetylglucosamine synthase-like glycosyltransferase
MKLLFWSSLFTILLTYVGYPTVLYFRALLWPGSVLRARIFPTVSVVLAVHNEENALEKKLQNLEELDYPADHFEVIVVSDGSTDGTNKILAAWEKPRRQAVVLRDRRGKAAALNCGIACAGGEIVVFSDARQKIASNGVSELVANFADPSVGCVSGELIVGEALNSACARGIGTYWLLEKNIRYWEGLTGSTVGATGAFYAVRKGLLRRLPTEAILDDVYIPLDVVRQGQRVIFERKALAWDDLKPSSKQEFRRKVRTLLGNYQLLELAPWVVAKPNPVRLRFVFHKLLRLLVPFALAGILVSTISLREGIYELAFGLQLLIYAPAMLALFRMRLSTLSRLSEISFAFVLLNAAAAVAFFYFVARKKAAWI